MVLCIIVRDDNGYLNVPYLNCNVPNPYVNWYNLDNRWNDNEFALREQLSHFSPVLVMGEFCFWICPLHPPRFFPISSNGIDKFIYLLSSIDFVSHKIINKTFCVSNFRIASLIHGNFSSLDRKLATDMASILSINKVSILCPRVCLCSFGNI